MAVQLNYMYMYYTTVIQLNYMYNYTCTYLVKDGNNSLKCFFSILLDPNKTRQYQQSNI